MTIWTRQEIEAYTPREDPSLIRLYEEVFLPSDDPEGRALFLDQVLEPCMLDQELIMRTARDEGRPAALNLLEDMYIESEK